MRSTTNVIRRMKKLLLLLLIMCWLATLSKAQITADLGLWGGSATAWTDMDDNTAFQDFNPSFGAYFRYNFNARVGLRAMFLTGSIAKTGFVEGYDWTFDKGVQDLTVQAEINYLKYVLGARKMRWTPYVTMGLGVAFFRYHFNSAEIAAFNPQYPGLFDNSGNLKTESEESVNTLTIPFGMGVKFTVGERLGLGVEYQMRKYMSDQLDDLDDPLSFEDDAGRIVTYTSTYHNNDWVGYLGVHLTYKIYLGKRECPAYGSKN